MILRWAEWCAEDAQHAVDDGDNGLRPNKGMKLTKPGQLRSFAAYPRCSTDQRSGVAYFGCVYGVRSSGSRDSRGVSTSRPGLGEVAWLGQAFTAGPRARESSKAFGAGRLRRAGSV